MIRHACALGMLFAVILQGSTGGHMLLVEHTRCAEHGELIHGTASHHDATESRATGNTGTLDRSPDGPSGGAHEHCTLTIDRREMIAAIGNSPMTRRLDEAAPLLLTIDSFVFVDTERFQTAPKHSPPA